MDGDNEDLLLVESDEEGVDAQAAALAARSAFALQHDSLFGLDSQSQHFMPAAPQSPAPQVPVVVSQSYENSLCVSAQPHSFRLQQH